MMEDNSATPLKEDHGNSSPEELTKEKLILKCKNLLTIAQKAKKARDECTDKNKVLSDENQKLTNKVHKLDKDIVTAQEMLATFTEQKLKLSMHLDELKKEKKQHSENMSNILEVKDQLETENISLKRQYTRLVNENEDLINQLAETETRLNNAITLKSDIEKLQRNNESIKHLCSNVTQEKMDLQNECGLINQKLLAVENKLKKFQDFMTSKFNESGTDIDSWINVINSSLEISITDNADALRLEDNDKFNKLSMEMEEALANLASANGEKNDLQTELEKCNLMNQHLNNELNSLNEDKNKMMSNLENMRIETRQLIESSEKLSEEIEALKLDKGKVENELTLMSNERNNLNVELSFKNNEIDKMNEQLNYLMNELSGQKAKLSSFEKICSDFNDVQKNVREMTEKNESLQSQINSLTEEAKSLQDKLLESNSESVRMTELHEKLQYSENNLKSELKSVLQNYADLQKKLLEMESSHKLNSSFTEKIEEKDRYIILLKTEIENLKIKFENSDDNFNKQLESLKFEKEELKCLVDTLKEESMENIGKLTQDLKEKEDLLSQSLIREKKIFEEFKSKLIELQNNNEKLSSEKVEIDKLYNEKCCQNEALTNELTEKRNKFETIEKDISSLNKQLNDINELLVSASELNKKYETDLLESQTKNKQFIFEIDHLKSTLSDTSATLKQVQNDHEKCESELKEFKSKFTDSENEIKNKELKITDLNNDLDKLKSSYDEVNVKFSILSEEFDKKTLELNQRNETIVLLEDEVKNSKESTTDFDMKLKELESENSKLKAQLNMRAQQENESVKIELKYQEQISTLQNTLKERSSELDNCRRTWLGHLTVLKGAFFGLKHSYEDLKKSVRDMQDFLTTLHSLTPVNFQEKINYCIEKALQSNKQDLLGEMQHMNQALKQRGEVISKLQNSISEMEQNMNKSYEETKELAKSLADVSSTLEDKEKQLKFKELFIKDLEAEISRLRENTESITDGDVMSCSTISKAEETSRLKDVEDSFEDKYAKLKLLAMKLKKRVNELNSALEEEKNKNVTERSELIDKVQSLTSAARNAQKLQESFDGIMDNFEEEKKISKNLETSLQSSLKVQEDLKTEISRLEQEAKKIPNMRKHIENLTSNVNNIKKELTALQKEKDVEIIKYSELKKEKVKLEEKVSDLSTSLEQALQQSRNNNLLELEMNNYEKTIDDLSAQLNSEKEKVRNVKGEMESLVSVKSGLEEQIKLLENQIKIEEERNSLSNKQLTTAKEALAEMQNQLSEKSERCDLLETELQEEKQKYESMACQASTVTSQFTAKEKELESQLNSFQRVVCVLEGKVSNSEEEVSRCKAELERVQSEFDSYRKRAQAVLAKQRGETISHAEREASEQIDKLNHENQILTKRIDSLMSEIEMMKTEMLTYSHEKDRADRRMEDLNKLLQYKTMELDKINLEYRSFRISTETLKQCFKTELEDKELSYKSLIDDYKCQIDDLLNANKLLESPIESGRNAVQSGEDPSVIQPDGTLESLPQQREEGEGSESVPSPQVRKRSTNLVPLDVLLNTPYDSESRIGLLCDRIALLEKEVSGYEVRCRHLAGLLSEAERDSARNSQLNSLLKEEIRRLERSLQRQPHAANTEYLKNVIFKFATLQGGDEKSRLVPVLDTILKLSPEETAKLNAVARGEVGSGWSNYLPSWTGL